MDCDCHYCDRTDIRCCLCPCHAIKSYVVNVLGYTSIVNAIQIISVMIKTRDDGTTTDKEIRAWGVELAKLVRLLHGL